MPWYVFNTSQGPRQLYAETPDRAAILFFQQTGITQNPAGSVGEQPQAGIQFLQTGSGGSATQQLNTLPSTTVRTAQPVPAAPGAVGTVPESTGLGRAGAFRRALQRRGVDLGTLAGNALLGQQGEFENVFDVLQALNRTPGGEQAFENFAGGTPESVFSLARGLAGELAGTQPTNNRLRSILAPGTDDELEGTARFLNAAIRGQVGAFGSNPFLRALVARLPEEFAAQPTAAQSAQPFFDFARQRIGLF